MIRPLEATDIGEAAAVLRATRIDGVWTERGFRHWIESTPERAEARWWVAEQNERVVGSAVALRRWWHTANNAHVLVDALPAAREFSRLLWDVALGHIETLGAEKVYTDALDSAETADELRSRGFRAQRVDRVSAVDPRSVDLGELDRRLARARDEGYVVVTLAEVDDLLHVYELDLELMDDMPGQDSPHSMTFEEWARDMADNPDISMDGTTVVIHERRPVALCLLAVDEQGRRARNEETGTARAHRRRGLATLAKLATIRWAVENGIREIVTDNAEENAGMLAINERLGYRPLVTRRRWVR